MIRLDEVPNVFNGGAEMDFSPKKKEYEYPRGTFYLMPLDIFERGLSVNAFAVYNALAYMSDENGQCFPSRMTIGKCSLLRNSPPDCFFRILQILISYL